MGTELDVSNFGLARGIDDRQGAVAISNNNQLIPGIYADTVCIIAKRQQAGWFKRLPTVEAYGAVTRARDNDDVTCWGVGDGLRLLEAMDAPEDRARREVHDVSRVVAELSHDEAASAGVE